MPTTLHDVLILGAGLSGLAAARGLQAAGQRVLVVDKGRGVSGRAATRRWDEVPVDHGAQFFTARSPEFRAQVADWEARGVCFDWARGFHQFERGTLRPPDAAEAQHPRYACREGMSALGKDLASGLTVELEQRAVSLRAEAGGWHVRFEDQGEERAGRALILAMPVPQALDLLETVVPRGAADDALAPLRAVDIGPSLAVLRRLPADGPAPAWRGIQARGAGETVSWIGADWDKRPGFAEREGRRVYVLHGGAEFSRAWVDADLAEAGRRITARGAEMVGGWMADARGEQQVHRWRFAVIRRGFDDPAGLGCHELPLPAGSGRVLVTGDAFCGGKVEGAWRSGRAAAARLGAVG